MSQAKGDPQALADGLRDEEEDEACPMCGGAGFVRKKVPLNHPQFGMAFPCACTQTEAGEDRVARLQRVQQSKVTRSINLRKSHGQRSLE